MSTEELHTEFHRRSSDLWGARLFVWLAAALVFLFLLLVAPHTNDPNFVRALAVAWPIFLAFVSAWRMSDRRRATAKRDASISGEDAAY
jgi:hypothetical protein